MRNFFGLARGLALFLVLTWPVACGGQASDNNSKTTEEAPDARASKASIHAPSVRDACELLDVDTVSRIYGKPLRARPDEAGPHWSSCLYEDVSEEAVAALGDFAPESGGLFVMGITAYYAGGRQEWQTSHTARGAARKLIKQREGVDVDTIVRPGYVLALGDAAYYSDLLPSQVLIGDTLIEFKMPFLPDPERHFRALARKVIRQLRSGAEN